GTGRRKWNTGALALSNNQQATLSGYSLDDAERAALLAALDGQRWHVSRVAEQLGISRNTLYRKLRRHGLVRGQA
ncbi:helix-turn-helix domain-containing protein, partial [Pseudomonas aeruginosa]|uniref:helix-turn-helix domain-containing protein n=1 Tax=Pseudomonas aeruginosa TaxID=287 RepID=UPI001FCA357F